MLSVFHTDDTSNGMRIFVFGNRDFPPDSLPLRILPELQQKFPDIEFEIKDPNEEWDIPTGRQAPDRKITVIDTVQGIDKVTVFYGLENFADSPRLTMHDFDTLANLKLLQKLGKIDSVKIIGVPQGLSEKDALEQILLYVDCIGDA